MRVPGFVWNRRHNLATITVSFARRVWDTVDHGELILGYAATGRLAKVILLDPNHRLAPGSCCADAIAVAIRLLEAAPDRHAADLDVLRSALDRAPGRLARGA